MVASCGVMVNDGARSFSWRKESEGWERRNWETDTEQPLADKARHDATLLQHLVKRDNAGAQSQHGLHKAETFTANSRGRFKSLSDSSHAALHGDWRINRRENLRYTLSWAIVLRCSQGQQWIKRCPYPHSKSLFCSISILPNSNIITHNPPQPINTNNSQSISINRW